MSLSASLRKLQRAVERLTPTSRSKKSQRRKPAKRRTAPNRDDRAAKQLVERVHAELPEVFGPRTVLELYGPWDYRPSFASLPPVPRARRVDGIAWASRGTDLSLCDGEPGVERKTKRRPGRPLAHLGADTTTGLEPQRR